MSQTMREISRRYGWGTADAVLLRLGNNAVYALPEAGVVIRIARSHRLADRVEKTVRLARWFESIDAPTIRLAGPHAQPIKTGDLLATVWRYVPPNGDPPTARDLGVALREFHALGTPPFELPQWNPVRDARKRLADAEGLAESDHRTLTLWCDDLEPRLAAFQLRTGEQLVHGDAHVGNLLRDRQGRIIFCDFDPICLGPWQADLVAVAVGEVRFGRAGIHQQLAESYGWDIRQDRDWPLLREARELKMIVAGVPLLTSSPGVTGEFTRRLRSVLDGELTARWTPFADLR